jgi:hypothetical protein
MLGFRRKRVAVVLGAGPAGLLAAHAAERRGMEVNVFTAPDGEGGPKKSELHGCQYLHAHIPGVESLNWHGQYVQYQIEGGVEQYRRKVYGEAWNGTVSPDEFGPEGGHLAWDLRKLYDELWERWLPRIIPMEVTPTLAQKIADVRGQLTFSTIPARSLCLRPGEHHFLTQDVWAMGTRSDGTPDLPYLAPNMTVLCNGNDAPRWYRAATVFGHSTLEWPDGPKPPISGVARVQKPLGTDCNCHRWYRLGRYGRWAKGVLVHEAYFEALVLR